MFLIDFKFDIYEKMRSRTISLFFLSKHTQIIKSRPIWPHFLIPFEDVIVDLYYKQIISPVYVGPVTG